MKNYIVVMYNGDRVNVRADSLEINGEGMLMFFIDGQDEQPVSGFKAYDAFMEVRE